ncbi:hypothetical protein LCGC14_2328220, partial [marine sediment metagenome]
IYALGNVGIGTSSPGKKLVVVGNANVSQNLTVNNSLLFVDGTSGMIGIGTLTPIGKLQVVGGPVYIGDNPPTNFVTGDGALGVEGYLHIKSTFRIEGNQDFIIGGASTRQAIITYGGGDGNARTLVIALEEPDEIDVAVLVLGDDDVLNADLGLFDGITETSLAIISNDLTTHARIEVKNASDTFNIYVNDSSTPAITILDNGNVGIGTAVPAYNLVVVGNLNVSTTLNVSGNISFTQLISCDTINTNDTGLLTCGNDAVGAGGGSPFLNENFTARYDLRTDRFDDENFTAGYNSALSINLSQSAGIIVQNLTVLDTNFTIGNLSIGLFNSTCAGFRLGIVGGWILSCEP